MKHSTDSQAGFFSTFQSRCWNWVASAFPKAIYNNLEERTLRFTEEALELVQAAGLSKERVLSVVEHVYAKEPGEVHQELGGSMVTFLNINPVI